MPAVPAPPAGATTIVLNWHWACADPPPAIDIAGITVCTSCNIAISVRVGSAGDTGDITQSIVASAAAAAAGVADTIQASLQTAIPPSSPLPDSVAAPALVAVQEVTYRIDDMPFVPPAAPVPADDLPRHGAPTAFGGGGAGQPTVDDHLQSRTDSVLNASLLVAASARVSLFQKRIVRRAVATREAVVRPGGGHATAPKPVPPVPPPSAPTPFILSAEIATTHGGGGGVVTALASGLAMILLYAISTVLRLLPVVPPARAAGANPHPPG